MSLIKILISTGPSIGAKEIVVSSLVERFRSRRERLTVLESFLRDCQILRLESIDAKEWKAVLGLDSLKMDDDVGKKNNNIAKKKKKRKEQKQKKGAGADGAFYLLQIILKYVHRLYKIQDYKTITLIYDKFICCGAKVQPSDAGIAYTKGKGKKKKKSAYYKKEEKILLDYDWRGLAAVEVIYKKLIHGSMTSVKLWYEKLVKENNIFMLKQTIKWDRELTIYESKFADKYKPYRYKCMTNTCFVMKSLEMIKFIMSGDRVMRKIYGKNLDSTETEKDRHYSGYDASGTKKKEIEYLKSWGDINGPVNKLARFLQRRFKIDVSEVDDCLGT